MTTSHRIRHPNRVKDLTGQRFGRLIVLRQNTPPEGRRICWECRCDCGNLHTTAGGNLKSGHARSCGCLQSDTTRKRSRTHGLTQSVEWKTWARMLRRCYNKNSPEYVYYGPRGITVCDRWRHSFENFLADMGKRPPDTSLDRVNNDGIYEASNCRWTDKSTQMRNRRNAVMLTFQGRTQNMVAWAEELGVPEYLLQNRVRYGWSHERILSTPNFGRSRKGINRTLSS